MGREVSEMNNKPVAIRYDFDGYGYQYMDSGSGSDWQTRVKGEPLYTHPVKELTDEEIHQAIRRGFARDGFLSDGIFLEIKELLRKA